MGRILGAAAIVSLMAGTAGAADNFTSQYTDLDFEQCTRIIADEIGATFACPGYRGIPVMVGEGDLRMFVSFGLTSTTEKAAEETLPPFNHLGAKIEWRLKEGEEGYEPVATILRWYTQREEGEGEGQVLVVTQIKMGATCHIAYIDATANANANDLAREAADTLAGDFDCQNTMPQVRGRFEAFDLE